ncbi:MAG TPA: hypothetical protein VG965_00160 [Patescibacteria group bacterium]|nr:hypothetical protein [Patescibacteria group bacterium]
MKQAGSKTIACELCKEKTLIKVNAKIGVAAMVAALFIAFAAFGLGSTTTSAASDPGGVSALFAPSPQSSLTTTIGRSDLAMAPMSISVTPASSDDIARVTIRIRTAPLGNLNDGFSLPTYIAGQGVPVDVTLGSLPTSSSVPIQTYYIDFASTSCGSGPGFGTCTGNVTTNTNTATTCGSGVNGSTCTDAVAFDSSAISTCSSGSVVGLSSCAAPAAPVGIASFGNDQNWSGFTNTDGIISAYVYVNPDLPGATPGKMNDSSISVCGFGTTGVGLATSTCTRTTASTLNSNIILAILITDGTTNGAAPISTFCSFGAVQCGEKSTITATLTDSVGQNVFGHTRVELVSNAGAIYGGTGSNPGLPGMTIVNAAGNSAAEIPGAITLLLTSTDVGANGVVASTTSYNCSPAAGSAQVTVTCALSTTAASKNVATLGNIFDAGFTRNLDRKDRKMGGSITDSIQGTSAPPLTRSSDPTGGMTAPTPAERLAPDPQATASRLNDGGGGIRPPNTGDAGLADASGSSWAFVLAGAVAFALAGIASVKFARR